MGPKWPGSLVNSYYVKIAMQVYLWDLCKLKRKKFDFHIKS